MLRRTLMKGVSASALLPFISTEAFAVPSAPLIGDEHYPEHIRNVLNESERHIRAFVASLDSSVIELPEITQKSRCPFAGIAN